MMIQYKKIKLKKDTSKNFNILIEMTTPLTFKQCLTFTVKDLICVFDLISVEICVPQMTNLY